MSSAASPFQQWKEEFQALGLLKGEPQRLAWLERSRFDRISTEQLFLCHTAPPSAHNLDPECIYGGAGGAYIYLLEKLSELVPQSYQARHISQQWHRRDPEPPVIELRFQLAGQALCCYLPRPNDFARPECVWLWNQWSSWMGAEAQFKIYGGWADWFVCWCDPAQSEALAQRGWQALELTASSDWFELQFEWALRQGHEHTVLEWLGLYEELFSPETWVYRGEYLRRRGDTQGAWESWSQAMKLGLKQPFELLQEI